jgi:hypothetical protein
MLTLVQCPARTFALILIVILTFMFTLNHCHRHTHILSHTQSQTCSHLVSHTVPPSMGWQALTLQEVRQPMGTKPGNHLNPPSSFLPRKLALT